MLKDFVYLLLSVIRILLIAYSYSGAGMEYDQAIVLFPIVDNTKQKKNWKRIKDAIAYGSWFSQPQKSCVEILYIRNFAYFHFKHTQKKIQISFQCSCVADGIKDHIRQS